VEVVVNDDGMGMSPRDDSPGLGLGLSLISRLADQTEYRTSADGRGLALRMSFRFDAA
jgi:anti-sigma regulatory factor (Ser/Thr protein kinase)